MEQPVFVVMHLAKTHWGEHCHCLCVCESKISAQIAIESEVSDTMRAIDKGYFEDSDVFGYHYFEDDEIPEQFGKKEGVVIAFITSEGEPEDASHFPFYEMLWIEKHQID